MLESILIGELFSESIKQTIEIVFLLQFQSFRLVM